MNVIPLASAGNEVPMSVINDPKVSPPFSVPQLDSWSLFHDKKKDAVFQDIFRWLKEWSQRWSKPPKNKATPLKLAEGTLNLLPSWAASSEQIHKSDFSHSYRVHLPSILIAVWWWWHLRSILEEWCSLIVNSQIVKERDSKEYLLMQDGLLQVGLTSDSGNPKGQSAGN